MLPWKPDRQPALPQIIVCLVFVGDDADRCHCWYVDICRFHKKSLFKSIFLHFSFPVHVAKKSNLSIINYNLLVSFFICYLVSVKSLDTFSKVLFTDSEWTKLIEERFFYAGVYYITSESTTVLTFTPVRS